MRLHNGNRFIVAIDRSDNNAIKIKYTNKYYQEQKILSLQDALNINKYAPNIENNIKSHTLGSHLLQPGYYTYQNPDKKIALYSEKLHQKHYNERSYVKAVNIKYREHEIEL